MLGAGHHLPRSGGLLHQAEKEVSVRTHKVLVQRPDLPLTQFVLAGLYDGEVVQVPEVGRVFNFLVVDLRFDATLDKGAKLVGV